MTVPGYHVLKEEEDSLQYSQNSPFADPEHPFRKDLETMRFQEEEEDEGSEADADEADAKAGKEEK
tara:strand:- start:660 stop:857 length:198 start_codon:yes stop_codon:yes gene_type:complete